MRGLAMRAVVLALVVLVALLAGIARHPPPPVSL